MANKPRRCGQFINLSCAKFITGAAIKAKNIATGLQPLKASASASTAPPKLQKRMGKNTNSNTATCNPGYSSGTDGWPIRLASNKLKMTQGALRSTKCANPNFHADSGNAWCGSVNSICKAFKYRPITSKLRACHTANQGPSNNALITKASGPAKRCSQRWDKRGFLGLSPSAKRTAATA